MRQWFVAQTQPNDERRAQENLSRQGYQSFLPLFAKTKTKGQRSFRVFRPVFPGYMFVKFDLETDRWRAINATRGIRTLVSFGDVRPMAIPNETMDELFDRCDDRSVIQRSVDLKPGTSVRVNEGPFAEMLGSIEKTDTKGRISVLMSIFGRPLSVVISPENLGPVG